MLLIHGVLGGVLGLLVLSAINAWPHPLDPALLELWETSDGVVQVRWRQPRAQPANAPLTPILPAACHRVATPSVSHSDTHVTQRWELHCSGQRLVATRLGVEGLAARQTDALLRVHLADGRLVQAVLRPGAPFFTVPPQVGRLDVARDYGVLGVEHILTGFDHLLFVLGLVLLVPGGRRLLATITAFTLGHSVTLALAVLGVVHIPPAPVELLIAVSIFLVAVELTRARQGQTLGMGRRPWGIAGAFGLLHGLGFAGALAQVGLPSGDIPLALAAFNVGIEAGQLGFVALVLTARHALGWLPGRWQRAGTLAPAYTIGSLAVFWVCERMAALIF
jgi:hypothetical protein